MAPNINNPGGVKNDPDEIRDAVVSDATRFPGEFINQPIGDAGAPVAIKGQFQVNTGDFLQAFDVSSQDQDPRGVSLSTDGSRMFVAGRSNSRVYQYDLSTDFDITTASFDTSVRVATNNNSQGELTFSPDGSNMYIIDSPSDNINQYELTSGFDVSTASFTGSFNTGGQNGNGRGIALNPDGTQIYICSKDNTQVVEYDLSTAFDVTSATFVQTFDVSSQDLAPQGMQFDADGGLMYVAGISNDTVFQYSLSTPFDISTASLQTNLNVGSQDSRPTGIAFSPAGSRMYLVGNSGRDVNQYALGSLISDEP